MFYVGGMELEFYREGGLRKERVTKIRTSEGKVTDGKLYVASHPNMVF